MWTRPALLGATVLAFAAACSLTTSLSGLSGGDPAGDAGSSVPEGGDVSVAAVDATADAPSPPDGGASAYAAAVLADSPLAYFRFDDTGATAKDETGAHDGTYKGAIAHAAGAIASDPSVAAVLNGTSYIEVGDVLSFPGNAPFTFEAWASPVPGATDPMCLLAKTFAPGGVSGGVAEGYTFYADDGSNALHLARFTNSNATGPSGPVLQNMRFTHVVATYDGAIGTIFLDGVAVETGGSSEAMTTVTSPLTIGAGRGGIYCYFRGALDEVAVYGKSLSAARVLAHYVAGTTK